MAEHRFVPRGYRSRVRSPCRIERSWRYSTKRPAGPGWTNSVNWLTDAPLRDWYGVDVDDQGRVVRLVLSENKLAGPIPAELGSLANLEFLWLSVNRLTGPIPPELGNLAHLWRLNLWNNQLSGSIPPELGDLENLKALSLGTNNLAGPIPPELGNLAKLEQLFLGDGAHDGSIPPELGKLAKLQRLAIRGTSVTGSIPPELGNLSSLEYMWLNGNELTGSIPPELGLLTKLRYLILGGNNLTGPIPRELGALGTLEGFFLSENSLTGAIPPELGRLANLKELYLSSNELSGTLPPEIGNLPVVEVVFLGNNDLEGPVPPELGQMSSLRELDLAYNNKMAGALPSAMTALHRLEALIAGGTGLCVPSDPAIQAWLERVHTQRIAPCLERDPPLAYLTQAVQSREFPVPLVAGEEALLRVFPTAGQATSEGIPLVRARFYLNGRETHVVDIPGKSTPIPAEVDESSLAKSANVQIPAMVMQPGLEMVIEVDPPRDAGPGARSQEAHPRDRPPGGRCARHAGVRPDADPVRLESDQRRRDRGPGRGHGCQPGGPRVVVGNAYTAPGGRTGRNRARAGAEFEQQRLHATR